LNEKKTEKEEDLVICRCEEVSKKEIVEAIKSGARTINGVKRRTRAGMGLCQGRTCWRLVAQIIAESTNQNLSEMKPPSIRPPLRPVKMGILYYEGEE